jgi:hypothetical protein
MFYQSLDDLPVTASQPYALVNIQTAAPLRLDSTGVECAIGRLSVSGAKINSNMSNS